LKIIWAAFEKSNIFTKNWILNGVFFGGDYLDLYPLFGNWFLILVGSSSYPVDIDSETAAGLRTFLEQAEFLYWWMLGRTEWMTEFLNMPIR